MAFSKVTPPIPTPTPARYKRKHLREVYVTPGLQYKLSCPLYCPPIQNIELDRRLARKSLPNIYGQVNNALTYSTGEYFNYYDTQSYQYNEHLPLQRTQKKTNNIKEKKNPRTPSIGSSSKSSSHGISEAKITDLKPKKSSAPHLQLKRVQKDLNTFQRSKSEKVLLKDQGFKNEAPQYIAGNMRPLTSTASTQTNSKHVAGPKGKEHKKLSRASGVSASITNGTQTQDTQTETVMGGTLSENFISNNAKENNYDHTKTTSDDDKGETRSIKSKQPLKATRSQPLGGVNSKENTLRAAVSQRIVTFASRSTSNDSENSDSDNGALQENATLITDADLLYPKKSKLVSNNCQRHSQQHLFSAPPFSLPRLHSSKSSSSEELYSYAYSHLVSPAQMIKMEEHLNIYEEIYKKGKADVIKDEDIEQSMKSESFTDSSDYDSDDVSEEFDNSLYLSISKGRRQQLEMRRHSGWDSSGGGNLAKEGLPIDFDTQNHYVTPQSRQRIPELPSRITKMETSSKVDNPQVFNVSHKNEKRNMNSEKGLRAALIDISSSIWKKLSSSFKIFKK